MAGLMAVDSMASEGTDDIDGSPTNENLVSSEDILTAKYVHEYTHVTRDRYSDTM